MNARKTGVPAGATWLLLSVQLSLIDAAQSCSYPGFSCFAWGDCGLHDPSLGRMEGRRLRSAPFCAVRFADRPSDWIALSAAVIADLAGRFVFGKQEAKKALSRTIHRALRGFSFHKARIKLSGGRHCAECSGRCNQSVAGRLMCRPLDPGQRHRARGGGRGGVA